MRVNWELREGGRVTCTRKMRGQRWAFQTKGTEDAEVRWRGGGGQPGEDEGLKEKQKRQRRENEAATSDFSVLRAMRSHESVFKRKRTDQISILILTCKIPDSRHQAWISEATGDEETFRSFTSTWPLDMMGLLKSMWHSEGNGHVREWKVLTLNAPLQSGGGMIWPHRVLFSLIYLAEIRQEDLKTQSQNQKDVWERGGTSGHPGPFTVANAHIPQLLWVLAIKGPLVPLCPDNHCSHTEAT